jgi:hypothetical protein
LLGRRREDVVRVSLRGLTVLLINKRLRKFSQLGSRRSQISVSSPLSKGQRMRDILWAIVALGRVNFRTGASYACPKGTLRRFCMFVVVEGAQSCHGTPSMP